jgi:hypothetical protein
LSDAACDGSSGAIGIAWDAEIAARPSPIANADAASIFMVVPFLVDTLAVTNPDFSQNT